MIISLLKNDATRNNCLNDSLNSESQGVEDLPEASLCPGVLIYCPTLAVFLVSTRL
jgi:hypothetical protein